MALNVNTNLYKLNGVDSASVAKVAGEILGNAQANNAQPQVIGLDYSKFNRLALGIDLYSNRTSVELQKQVSMIQAGLYSQAVNVAQLNASAAMNLYSANTVQKNVELTQSTTVNELASPRAIEESNQKVEFFNILDGSSNSSNGYNPFGEESSDSEKSEK